MNGQVVTGNRVRPKFLADPTGFSETLRVETPRVLHLKFGTDPGKPREIDWYEP
jgi:hypothetical protein